MSKYQFQGIVAVGNTRPQAINRYRMLAMGKGAACFVDRSTNEAFISNASSDMENIFNPKNGNMDLEQSPEVLNGLAFEAKAGDVHEAYHYQCTSGCGTHLLFDAPSFVQFCPACASEIVSADDDEEDDVDDLTDEELDDLVEEDEDDESEDLDDEEEIEDEESDEESATASDEADEEVDDEEEEDTAEEDDSEEDADDESEEDEESDEDDSEDDADDADDSEDADEADDEEDDMADAPLVVAAASRDEAINKFTKIAAKKMTATASSIVSAEYKVCASDTGCGAHVVSQIELVECPREGCGAPLSEPKTVVAGDLGDGNSLSLIEEAEEALEDQQADEAVEDEAVEDEADEEEEGADDASAAVASDDEDEDSDDEREDEIDETSEVSVDLFEAVPDDASADDFDVSYSASIAGQPTWTAYYKGRPVAMASVQNVKEDHRAMFGTERFGAVAMAASRQAGPKNVLRELGFTGIAATMNVSKYIEDRVVALASQQQEQMLKQQEEYSERLSAALATAAIGINRGFFQGQTNPVRDSLLAALASSGFRNPEVIVDNALRTSLETFLSVAFDRAADIMSKPLEVQESLSRTVLDVAYMPQQNAKPEVATASSHGNLEDRLSGLGTVIASAEHPQPRKTEQAVVAATASDDFSARLGAVMSGLGRR